MRVCFFSTGESLQGGAERCQEIIVRHMIATGHTAHVVLQKPCELSDRYEAIGARVHHLYWQHLRTLADPLHVLKYLLLLPIITVRLALLLRRERIDLLHVNEILDFQGLAAARLAGVPAAVFVRVILPNRLIRAVLARLARLLAHRVVCVSQAVHRDVFGADGGPKVCVIHDGGPDYEMFNPARTEPKRPPGATDDTVVVGMVAKFVAWKGHEVFVELARRLVQIADGRDLRFVIVGGQIPGHEAFAAKVRSQIDAAGLADRFWLVGKQLDVAGYMAGMDILCHLPLWEDPFPGVPMEAAAMGRCVLAFRSGGVPEELTDPTSCRLAPIGDIDALTATAIELIADPAARAAMGQAAAEEVRGKFSHEGHLREIDALYDSLVHRHE